jgi:hypothetical protein
LYVVNDNIHQTRKVVDRLEGHTDVINNLLVDNTNIYSCSDDGKIFIWDKTVGHNISE